MGIFKSNKNKIEISAEEIKREELAYTVYDSLKLLSKKVINVYVIGESLKVYPEGADKQAEIKTYEDEKKQLLNYIAAYEENVKNYNVYNAKFDFSWVTFKNSHEVIRNTIEEFLGKK